MKHTRLPLILILITSAAFGQELRLKTAIDEAKQYSPSVQNAQANLEGARWKKIESYSEFLPTLSGDVNYFFTKKYAFINVDINGNPASFPQIFPTSQFLLTGSLPLFDGFSNINRYRAGAHAYEAAENNYEWTEFTTEMQTTLLFYRAIVAGSLMDVATQNAHTIEDHYKDVIALQKAGVSTKFDVLRVEVQRDEASAEVLKSQDEFEFSKIRLVKIMGKDNDNRTPTGELPTLQPNLLTAYEANSSERRDLIALSEQNKSLTSEKKSEGRFWIPSLSMIGQVQAYNNINDEFSDWDAYRNAYQMGFNLHWNFFDGMSSIARYNQAKARAMTSDSVVRQAALKSSEDAQIWKKKFEYYCKLIEVKTAESEKAQEAVRLAKESVRAGTKTNADLLDAELDLFKARADVLNVRMGAVDALINFQMAIGKKVYDFQS